MLLHSPAPKTGTRPDHSFNECLERHIRIISCTMEYIQQDFDQNAQPIVFRLSRWNQSKVLSDFDYEETYDIYGCPNNHWPAWQGFRAQIQSMHLHDGPKSRINKNLPVHLFDQLEDGPLALLDGRRTRLAL